MAYRGVTGVRKGELYLATYTFNRLGVMAGVIVLLLLGGGVFGLMMYFAETTIAFFIPMGMLLLLLVVMLPAFYRALLRKVEFDKHGVVFRTPFDSQKLDWDSVRSYGGFVRSRHACYAIGEEEIDSWTLAGTRFIYVSSEENPTLRNDGLGKGYICLQYRPEALRVIRENVPKSVSYG